MKFEELPSAESYYDGVRIHGLKSTMVKAIEQAQKDAWNACINCIKNNTVTLTLRMNSNKIHEISESRLNTLIK